MSRTQPAARKLELIRERILETDIPYARKQGVDLGLLRRCSKPLRFISYQNPYKYLMGSRDRHLALERLIQALREVKRIGRRIQAALKEMAPPTQDELDAERFLLISREQKAVLPASSGTPFRNLKDQVISRNAAFGALDVFIGTTTGYHGQAYMEAQREAGKVRPTIRSAVAFSRGKDRFVSMEDGRLAPYKLQQNAVERGDLTPSSVGQAKVSGQGVFSAEYLEWLEQMLAVSDDG